MTSLRIPCMAASPPKGYGDVMEPLRLSMVSMNSKVGDVEGNRDRIIGTMSELASDDVNLVCFPELSLTGYSTEHSPGLACPMEDPDVMAVVDASAESGVAVCFGLVEDGPYITQAVAEDGRIVGSYRKTHLGERESSVFLAGDAVEPIRLRKAVVGVQTCWESHFPLITAEYAMKGADIILMPHASGLAGGRRMGTWGRILPARAYDNTVFVAACNMAGDNGYGTVFGGCAVVYDVRGNIIAEDGSGECVLTVDLDPGDMERIRTPGYESMRDLYFLDKSRPELFSGTCARRQ